MKIRIISDLHLEHGPFALENIDCDLLIIAGDLHVKTRGIEWLRQNTHGQTTIYVPGNHEYYGEKLPSLDEKLAAQAKSSNVNVLSNSFFDFKGYRIFGSTFWTDMKLFDSDYLAAETAKQVMTDFKRIRLSGSYRRLRPVDFQMFNAEGQRAMRSAFADIPRSKRICVTHHSPSARSLPETFRYNKTSCAYASNLDLFVEEISPILWVHGHIHCSSYYRIGSTTIVCNPRGYVDEPNTEFKPDLILDTDLIDS